MSIKNFRITAKYKIQRREFVFRKEIRALDVEKALEKFYSILGSQNIKRTAIRIVKIEEIEPIGFKNRRLQRIALSKEPVLYVEER